MRGLLIFTIVLAMGLAAQGAMNRPGCGKRPLKPNKVVGGTQAIPGDWGWMTSMHRSGSFICGGSVIDEWWVVSAAHCTAGSANVANYILNVGGHDRLAWESWVISKRVSRIIQHAQYSASTLRNDIVLLKFDSPITFDNYYIIAVCVADGSEFFQGRIGWATGWGTLFSGGSVSRYNMQVAMLELTDARCLQKYTTAHTPSMICAGDNTGVDTCQGDSGGPYTQYSAVFQGEVLEGITSWGYGCGDGGVYTRVSFFYQWIFSTMAAN
jgi:secreted trypsin-like serine protease